MNKSKQNLTKIRLMCAVLASIELANAGVSSYAMEPSDPTSSQIQTNEIKERIISSVEMDEMAPDELLEYLMITSTPDKLKNYYQGRGTCKSKQDIINFEALSPKTKDNLFEYIFSLISERQLENFQSIPIEIRTNFFEYIIKQGYDLLDVFAGIGMNEYELVPNEFEAFMDEMLTVVSSRMAGIIFGKLILADENPFIKAMIHVDYDSLLAVTANSLNFDYNENIAKECNLIELNFHV